MSRVGKQPLTLPEGVRLSVAGGVATLEGAQGELSIRIPAHIEVEQEGNVVTVSRTQDDKQSRANHGTTRSLLANMAIGVKDGYSRDLEIVGVGFKATVVDRLLTMHVGTSHPIEYTFPEGVAITVTDNVNIKVAGIDKQLVGQVSARIRSFRPPEPYKGKGIRYKNEQVRRKAGKTVA